MEKTSIVKLATLIVLLCFVVSLFAMSCGSAQTAAPSSVPAKPTISQYGGVVKFSMTTDPIGLGWPADMTAAPDVFTSQACLESLARYDETGNLAPQLAEKWNLDDKAKTLTITLKKGIKFHDGTDFDAKAAKWNIDSFQKFTKRPEYTAIQSIDIVDDYTIKINLSKWDNTIVGMLPKPISFMISPASWQKAGATDKERNDWCAKNPVGTGPFKFVSWTRDVKQVFAKNPDYWQKGKPYLDGIEFIVIADPLVQMASLQKGEVDILYSTTANNVDMLKKQGTFTVANLKSGFGAAMRGLVGDSAHPNSPFSNIKVRQAVSASIDRNAINQAIFKGYGIVTDQLSLPGSWAYNPKVVGFPYDPAKAKQLLTEAGYPNGFKTKIYCRNDATSVDLYTAVQGFLSKVGIDAALEAMALAKQDEMSKTTGWSDGLFQYGVKVEADAILPMMRTTHSTGDLYTMSILHNDEIDKLIEKCILVPDIAVKQASTRDLQQLLFEKYTLYTTIVTIPSICVKNSKLINDKIREIEDTTWTPENAILQK